MISLYRSGNSVLHRIPAGWKLIGLIIVLALFGIFGTNIWFAIFEPCLVLVLYLLAGVSFPEFLKHLWTLKYLVLLVLIPQLIFSGFEKGSSNAIVLVSGVLLAALVSITTKTSEIVELIYRMTRSKNFALLIALSINSIALVVGFSKNITEAGLARGVKPNLVRQIVTLFVVSLRYADDYAEALAARGVVV